MTETHHTDELSHEEAHESDPSTSAIKVSKYSKALVDSWNKGSEKASLSANKISVSQTVSFFAFLYEKMRNAVEFKEENLIRKSAIERILRRRMLLNENGRDIAEPLIKELLWARYYENNTLGEEKIAQVQSVIDKYFFLRNETASGRSMREQTQIGEFIIDILSCAIEETLSPTPRRQAFINFVYQLVRNRIKPFSDDEIEKDIQVYIAVERVFGYSDDALIKYSLLRLMIPQIDLVSWKTADKILPEFFDVYEEIEKSLKHPLKDKMRTFVKKQIPPFMILQDIFLQNEATIESILTDNKKLKHKVDLSCRKRYEETKGRLRRTAVRSFIYIVLTKVVFAFLVEVPYDLYIEKSIAYIPILINVLFPPILMAIIILSVTVPGDENTRKIYKLIKEIITADPESKEAKEAAISIGKPARKRGLVFTSIFTALYLLTYFISFGTIIYILSLLHFNPVSQGVFLFFVTLVTFFAFRVVNITHEYQVVEREGPLTPLFDFFFLPIIRVGRWLSGEVLQRFNILTFVFDFVVEMPLKAIVEVVDEWVYFVKLKKEEIV